MTIEKIQQLNEVANQIRIDTINQIFSAQSGHPGGALSIAEMLSVLFFCRMNVNEKNPQWEDRDRFVLSKGHASTAYYSALAQKGFFDRKDLAGFRKIDGFLQGHPDMKKVPGVDMSTGSLGQGLSAANGMALAGKAYQKDYRVYVIMGDGEIQEGQIWEAAMTSAHYKLDNLTALLDNNNLQIDGAVTDVMSPYPIKEKFEAFGWHVLETNGHDVEKLETTLLEAETIKGKPTLILCSTTKGKGVSFMENQASWHGGAVNAEERAQALKDLGCDAKDIGEQV